MTRTKLARLLWKLLKRRNYYKKWYEYEVANRKYWTAYLDNMDLQLKTIKKDFKDVSFE